eukprot:CAMPEP_0119134926 /NCGR_PEP_ID=MMETSP1310-20130426/18248_1 /TAXON_ID=464262 /ORGANISM="Genus nov. species nov., Strain RCC2339" /LENGTH=66 /DNA_ID=CAMNT_0007125769 /DNA_START=283 /DNA_END=483 /DNA_ORIENTATION=-
MTMQYGSAVLLRKSVDRRPRASNIVIRRSPTFPSPLIDFGIFTSGATGVTEGTVVVGGGCSSARGA